VKISPGSSSHARPLLKAATSAGIVAVAAVLFAACSGGGSNDASQTTTPSPGPTERSADLMPFPGGPWPDWPNTDFSRTTVNLEEVIRGCPSRDCIPPLDAEGATSIPSAPGGQARFAPVADVSYPEQVPVAYVNFEGVVRGYPLHILIWHEVVNDQFGEVPVAVTFCPLCNMALAFDRRADGQTLDFGVSGNLRNSDLIMWDRQTESWWQQATGEAIVGAMAGTVLEPIPVAVISYGDFVRTFPSAEVLTEETGFSRDYGINPYGGYDTFGSTPFLFNGTIDPRLDGLERVVALGRDSDEPLAIPFAALAEHRVANVEVGDRPIVVFWSPGTTSSLDASDIAKSRDVGAAVAYEATLDGQALSFTAESDGRFRDEQTGSLWDVFGRALEGPLAGSELPPVVHTTEFWFAWAAFHSDTSIWAGP